MDGLGHALQLAGLEPLLGSSVLIVQFEIDSRCRRLLLLRVRPGVVVSDEKGSDGLPGSVLWLLEGGLEELLRLLPNLKRVFSAGGSPCVGFSRAKPGARGAQDEESSKVWMPVAIPSVVKTLKPSLMVGFLLENVEMDSKWVDGISKVLNQKALHGDCARVAAASRPRLFWTNIETTPLASEAVNVLDSLDEGWAPLASLEKPLPGDWRFGTFLRPFAPGAPREFPSDFWKLPLSQYSLRNLVYKITASDEEKATLKKWVKDSVSIDCAQIRDAGSSSQVARAKLCTWVHREGGGALLRPLRGHERALALGFPRDASSLPDDVVDDLGLNWGQLAMTGNSFSPKVVSHFLKQYVSSLLSGHEPALCEGSPTLSSKDAILQKIISTAEASQGKKNRR